MGLIRIAYRLKHISFRVLGRQPLAIWSTDNRFDSCSVECYSESIPTYLPPHSSA